MTLETELIITISFKWISRRIGQLASNLRRITGPLERSRCYSFPKDDLFKVQDVVDTQNRPVVEYSNDSRGGSKNLLQNSDTLHVRFENKTYLLRVIGFDTIRFD